MTRRLLIIGAGRVGVSLAADLRGWPGLERLVLAGRRSDGPSALAAWPDVEYVTGSPPGSAATEAAAGSDLVFAIRDDALADAAREWAEALAGRGRRVPGGRAVRPEETRVALHTSGARPAAVLAPLARAEGRALGSWHPLASVAAPGAGAFRGVTVGVEGDEAAVRLGLALAERVGARAVRIPTAGRARYHAAAVFASNYLLACLHAALEELRALGGDSVPDDALLPLARSALANYERLGLPAGATGPLSRGDVDTIAEHLRALDPPRRSLYRALGRELLDALRPSLTPGAAERLDELLSGP